MKNIITQFVQKVIKFTVLPSKSVSLFYLLQSFLIKVLIFARAFNDDGTIFNFE